MKGSLSLKFLELLSEIGSSSINLFEAFLSSGYGASSRKIEFQLNKISKRNQASEIDQIERKRRARQYFNLVASLKRDGLISEAKKEENRLFSITKKGFLTLTKLRKRRNTALPATQYRPQESKTLTIVAFDIPEREHRKRVWLRSALKNIGLAMLQKSVWVGKVKIPKEFLVDIKEMRIAEYVQILGVSKEGSLKPVIED